MAIESPESRYKESLSKLVPWLKDQIDKSPDKIIRIKVDDILNDMGLKFKKDISIYSSKKDTHIRALWELKYLLWPDEIVVNGTRTRTGEDVLSFRKAIPDDEAPPFGLTADVGESYYVKEIIVDLVTEDPFTYSDEEIKNIIDSINISDASMSVTKIRNWEKAPFK